MFLYKQYNFIQRAHISFTHLRSVYVLCVYYIRLYRAVQQHKKEKKTNHTKRSEKKERNENEVT